MVRKTVVRKNRYLDSVFLMRVARRIAAEPGIADASALMATGANLKVLRGMGYDADGRDVALAGAGPNDLVVALEGEAAAVDAIAAGLETWLTGGAEAAGGAGGAGPEPRSIAEAVAHRPDASVAVISVPGAHAAREARAALRSGLHVFLFSSQVPVEDELRLKVEARDLGLIVMGPDCGTAFLGGAGIGFANAVRRGPIGIVGSTGTGMQEVTCLVHQAGSGVSNGIGTGSRDLSDAIGGISTMMGVDALEADPSTEVIVVLSKPPGTSTAARLLERLERCGKPVVLCLLGSRPGSLDGVTRTAAALGKAGVAKMRMAATLDEAAGLALSAVGVPEPATLRRDGSALRALAMAQIQEMRPEQRHVRGLFAGGTLCYQAQAIFREAGLIVRSNSPLPGMPSLPDPWRSREDAFVDLGAEAFVEGRPHPMIDASLRSRRLVEEGEDPSVALVLLDFILGAMSSRDPAGDLLAALGSAQDAVRRRGGRLCVVASVCGTEGDAQGLESQRKVLEDAGVLLFPSHAQAAAFCATAARLLADRKEAR